MSEPRFDRWRNAYARVVAAATLVLVFAGGLVTSTGSGLAVPDWPLSYGMWFPPMVGGVLFEHGHRMIAGTVGLLTLALAIWTWTAEDRRWVRNLAGTALLAVVVQALLGGLTVIFLLPPAISVAHACLGQIFFCLVVALAAVTGASWLEARRGQVGDSALRSWSLALVLVVFVQLLLGASMRHLGAGLAIPDFPLSFGRIVPELSSTGVMIAYAHRLGALVVTLVAVGSALRVRSKHRDDAWLVRPALGILALVGVQVALGATTIWTSKAVVPTTAHVATGAAILAAAVVFACRVRFRTAPAAIREELRTRGLEGARA